MKVRIVTLAAVLGVLGASVFFLAAGPEAPAATTCDRQDGPTYVGAKTCLKCHFKHYMAWKKSNMAKAFETLKPNAKAAEKTKFKLDPAKDYTKDAKCVKCHVTGYGQPGGYPEIVEGKAWTAAEQARAKLMEGVSCESCHGPGSRYNVYKKDHKSYMWPEIESRGAINPDEKNCATCHNDQSPTHAKFVFEEKIGKDSHPFMKMKADHGCPHKHRGGN